MCHWNGKLKITKEELWWHCGRGVTEEWGELGELLKTSTTKCSHPSICVWVFFHIWFFCSCCCCCCDLRLFMVICCRFGGLVGLNARAIIEKYHRHTHLKGKQLRQIKWLLLMAWFNDPNLLVGKIENCQLVRVEKVGEGEGNWWIYNINSWNI